jgi:hypothetical protein
LSGNGKVNTNKKCIVFLKNYADFLENTPSSDKSQTPTLVPSSGVLSIDLMGEHLESYPNNSTISNVVGKKTKNAKYELSLSDDESPPATNNLGEYDKEPIENNLPFISVIMFTENGEPTYCVKTESIFMEL